MVRVGIALPSFVDDPEIPLRVARAADAAGVDGVFVYDHLWRGNPPDRRPALECFALAGAIAAETDRVMIGTLVARTTLRPPAVLAHSFDTLQRISGGRVIAGIGSGDSVSRVENEAFGLSFGTMVDRVRALHDSVFAVRGRDFPVWVGGRAKQVREIVAIADAWNRWGGSAAVFGANAQLVREVAPTAEITWGGLALLATDERGAQRKAAGRDFADDLVAGGPERAAERLQQYADAGASWVILGPVDSSDPDNAHVLGEAIRPLLR